MLLDKQRVMVPKFAPVVRFFKGEGYSKGESEMKCVRCTKEAKSFPYKNGKCEECSNEIYLGQEPIQN